MNKTSANVLGLPLETRAQMAFEVAFEKVLDQYARLGLPLSISQDGKVVEVSADKMREYLSKTK